MCVCVRMCVYVCMCVCVCVCVCVRVRVFDIPLLQYPVGRFWEIPEQSSHSRLSEWWRTPDLQMHWGRKPRRQNDNQHPAGGGMEGEGDRNMRQEEKRWAKGMIKNRSERQTGKNEIYVYFTQRHSECSLLCITSACGEIQNLTGLTCLVTVAKLPLSLSSYSKPFIQAASNGCV